MGRLGDTTSYQFSAGLDAPATIVLTDVPASLRALIQSSTEAQIVERDGLTSADFPALKEQLTGGQGFDDIVLLDPRLSVA